MEVASAFCLYQKGIPVLQGCKMLITGCMDLHCREMTHRAQVWGVNTESEQRDALEPFSAAKSKSLHQLHTNFWLQCPTRAACNVTMAVVCLSQFFVELSIITKSNVISLL